MATGNLILGLGRRSIGDVVMYRRNGKQVSRVRVRKIKNPKTDAQIISRVIVNTVAQAYSRMRGLTNHSFQGKVQGEQNMNRFVKLNQRMLREKIAAGGDDIGVVQYFTPVGFRGLAPNEYIMSEGSYKSIPSSALTTDAQHDKMQLKLTANTYAALIEDYGLQRGDQVTFVIIAGTVADIMASDGYPDLSDVHVSWARVILDPRNNDGTEADLSSALVDENGGINLPSPSNDGNQAFNYTFVAGQDGAAGSLTVEESDREVLAFGIIVSHKTESGSFEYSNCQLKVSDIELYANLGQAIAFSNSANIGTTSPLYLRQAKN